MFGMVVTGNTVNVALGFRFFFGFVFLSSQLFFGTALVRLAPASASKLFTPPLQPQQAWFAVSP